MLLVCVPVTCVLDVVCLANRLRRCRCQTGFTMFGNCALSEVSSMRFRHNMSVGIISLFGIGIEALMLCQFHLGIKRVCQRVPAVEYTAN